MHVCYVLDPETKLSLKWCQTPEQIITSIMGFWGHRSTKGKHVHLVLDLSSLLCEMEVDSRC